MPSASLIFTPLLLMLHAPVPVAREATALALADQAPVTQPFDEEAGLTAEDRKAAPPPGTVAHVATIRVVTFGSIDEPARQVRIERQTTIRVAPRRSRSNVPPSMFVELPRGAMPPRYVERKMGKCLPISEIAGVQAQGGDRLLLFMRDRRVVSAALERSCRSRDFYSGFYVAPTTDGKICVDRDTLLSRSGANCKLTRIRRLEFEED